MILNVLSILIYFCQKEDQFFPFPQSFFFTFVFFEPLFLVYPRSSISLSFLSLFSVSLLSFSLSKSLLSYQKRKINRQTKANKKHFFFNSAQQTRRR